VNQAAGHPDWPTKTRSIALSRHVIECVPWQPVRYRYLLHIALGPGRTGEPAGAPILTVIQKNPSLADAARSDPTAGKVEAWARRHAFASVIYVNLFALRSPDPRAVNDVSQADAIGAENDAAIVRACAAADVLVAAWGNPNGIDVTRYAARSADLRRRLEQAGYALHHVGALTRLGFPRHGLHWNGDAALQRWR